MLSSTRCGTSGQRLGQYLPGVAILLVCVWSLSFDLDRLSLSVDEFVNVEIDQLSPRLLFADLVSGRDLHPPLSHLVSSLWVGAFGIHEWSVRSVWVLTGVLAVAATYQLGQRLGARRLGLLAALLMFWLSTFCSIRALASIMPSPCYLCWLPYPFSVGSVVRSPICPCLYRPPVGLPLHRLSWSAIWLAVSSCTSWPGRSRKGALGSWAVPRRWVVLLSIVGLLYLPWIYVAIRQADIANQPIGNRRHQCGALCFGYQARLRDLFLLSQRDVVPHGEAWR